MLIAAFVPAQEVPANPVPASTVVVLRDGSGGPEVFMVRRHESTAFMGGAHVFPGGRVDAADADADATWCDGLLHAIAQLSDVAREEALAFHVAAARELFEEAGVLLARGVDGRVVSLSSAGDRARLKQDRGDVHGGQTTLRAVLERERLRLALDTLMLCAHWVTPPIDRRQFDTRFFMTKVPSGQTPAHDEMETTHGAWLTPAEAIALSVRGDIDLPPPTWTMLREIEPFRSVDAALAWARTRKVVRRQPKVLVESGAGGRRLLLLPGDPLHPDTSPSVEKPIETRFVFIDRRWRAERSHT
jgi:8-oxo-dGTP pyrophosphatase MutT (NUDIX family)